jgi:hypothetical protein
MSPLFLGKTGLLVKTETSRPPLANFSRGKWVQLKEMFPKASAEIFRLVLSQNKNSVKLGNFATNPGVAAVFELYFCKNWTRRAVRNEQEIYSAFVIKAE